MGRFDVKTCAEKKPTNSHAELHGKMWHVSPALQGWQLWGWFKPEVMHYKLHPNHKRKPFPTKMVIRTRYSYQIFHFLQLLSWSFHTDFPDGQLLAPFGAFRQVAGTVIGWSIVPIGQVRAMSCAADPFHPPMVGRMTNHQLFRRKVSQNSMVPNHQPVLHMLNSCI